MNSLSRSHLFAGFFLFLFAALIPFIAWPAAAGPQADFFSFLPFVTSPPIQLDEYETDFTDDIEPWMAVRWRENTEYTLAHNPDCDDGRCGFLDTEVKTMAKGTAVVVSPMIQGPKVPYNMHVRAKFLEIKDKNQYGLVFGGDWNGGSCPAGFADGCFNHYYEVRMRYRDDGSDKFMEYRIFRVDGHDSSGKVKGEDLLEWTRVDGLDNEGWIKWEVYYGADGEIRVKADNEELPGTAQDDTYIDNPYFGLFTRAVETGDTQALFDKYRITRQLDDYETDFTDSIAPWTAVRWRENTDYSVSHNPDCDGGRCGFLETEVEKLSEGAAVIVSPLIPGPKPPYNMHFRAKFEDIKDKNQYGVAFGGDWDGTAPCPGTNVDGCFNHYYEVRVRYRNAGGEEYMEYRIRRFDGYKEDGKEEGEDLLPWTRVDGLDNTGWVKWEVHYGSSGHIRVKADNNELPGYARDSKYIKDPYFGLFTRAVQTGDTKALFDKYRITKEE